MSRQDLADAVNGYLSQRFGMKHGIDAVYVGKLERGVHRWPTNRYRQAFRAVLHVNDDNLLGFYIIRKDIQALNPPGPSGMHALANPGEGNGDGPALTVVADRSWEPDGILPRESDRDREIMLRRTVFEGFAAMVGGGLLAQVGMNDTARHVDPLLAASIKHTATSYRHAYATVGSAPLLAAAVAHFDLGLSVIAMGPQRNERRLLLQTAGEMASLAGVLLAVDLAQHQQAEHYLSIAGWIAAELNDPDMQAVVLGCRSFAVTMASQDYAQGLALADRARSIATTASSTTRGWVAAVASEHCAALGDATGCLHRLDEAQQALQNPSETGWPTTTVGLFHQGKLTAYRGGAMVRLGRFSQAEPILNAAITNLDSTQPRHLATAYLDRADARMMAGDLDAACADAALALPLVKQVQHTRLLSRVQNVARCAEQRSIRGAADLLHEAKAI